MSTEQTVKDLVDCLTREHDARLAVALAAVLVAAVEAESRRRCVSHFTYANAAKQRDPKLLTAAQERAQHNARAFGLTR